MQDPSVRITYFSDVLCIWAYVAQIRCDELRERFGERVELERSYLQVFGNVAAKMDAAHRLTVRTSPTFLFNDDRQRLTGNVGYRILEANVKALLERPDGQSSWC